MAYAALEYSIEAVQEVDGRWIGTINGRPGILVYAATEPEARAKASTLLVTVLQAEAQRYVTGEAQAGAC